MTLTRPAYQVIVENHTAGWSYQATQGDDSTLLDDVQLADNLTAGWSFTNGETPAQLDPDQVTFRLFATSAEVLPAMSVGDLLTVDLLRPTAGDPIPYMNFVGRLTEPQLEPIKGRGLLVALTANGILADLAGTTIGDRTWPEFPVTVGFDPSPRIARIAELARINAAEVPSLVWNVSLGQTDVDARSALDLYVEVINSMRPYVLRGLKGWPGFYNPDYINNDTDLWYFPQTYARQEFNPDQGNAPYVLVADGLVAILDRQPLDVDDARQLSASHVVLGVTWRKDKADAVNRIAFQGIAPLSDTDADVTLISEHTDLVRDYGANSRTITTQVRDPLGQYSPGTAIELGDNWLPAYDDAIADWSVDTITVLPESMTDDELDRYARQFFPGFVDSIPDDLPSRLVILDVDDLYAVNGRAITALISGCTFSISAGELVIQPSLRAEAVDPDTFSDGITWSALTADAALSETTWDNPAALHIDPDLTWRDIALATI